MVTRESRLSQNLSKITLPHRKQVFRIIDKDNNFTGADAIALSQEQDPEIMYHPFDPLKSLSLQNKNKEPLLQKIMENGTRLLEPVSLPEIAHYTKVRLSRLPEEYKRFNFPHIYKVGLSASLRNERDKLIEAYKKIQ